MEAQTTVSNSTQCGLFTGEYKTYTVSGVTFSFKWLLYYCNRVCSQRPCWRSKTIEFPSFGKKVYFYANSFYCFAPPTWPP